MENSVTILKLPPHYTHVLQPLDIAVFKPLKDAWGQILGKWTQQNVGLKIPKKTFSEHVGQCWKGVSIKTIQRGIRKAGKVPYNSQVIPDEKYPLITENIILQIKKKRYWKN